MSSTFIPLHPVPTPCFARNAWLSPQNTQSIRLVENFDDTHGILEVTRLEDVCPDWRSREAWVCGPAPMLAAAEKHWGKARLTKNLHLERFSVVRTASAEGGRVVFAKSGKEAELDGATTLLEAGEAAGVLIALRLPDGHLPYLHRPLDQGGGEGPPKWHGVPGKSGSPDLHHGGGRRLCPRHLRRYTDGNYRH